jgi:hypothetical protein
LEAYFSYNKFSVRLKTKNFTPKEEQIIRKAAYFMCYALGLPTFKKFCLNYQYKIKTWYWDGLTRKYYYKKYRGFHETNGKSQIEVYNHLMSGQEMRPEETTPDQEADMFLKIDRSDGGNVIGYTYSGSIWQYIYQWVLEERSAEYVAGNLAHEWVHKCGYSHSKNSPTFRKAHKYHTVSYAVGKYVRDFLKKR